MKLFGNILWVLCGGAILSAMWCLVGLLCFCTIIFIPVGLQCLKFSGFILWPFGRNVIFSNSVGNFLLNVVWILVFGWELAIASCLLGLLWCVTIVGIPFGIQFFKFGRIALMPFGTQIITQDW